MINNYTDSMTSGLWYPTSVINGLNLKSGATKDTYMVIYNCTHNSENDWYSGGLEYIKDKINAKSINSVRYAINFLLNNEYIIADTKEHTNGNIHTYYRINTEILYNMGIWKRNT